MSAQLTLDQFRVFLAVHDEGSFSAAARRLNRAQSAVSRTVVALENAIGVKLFDRAGYRPQVTQAGKALLADARTVIDRERGFHARVSSIVGNVEPDLGLAVHFSLSMQSSHAGAEQDTAGVSIISHSHGAESCCNRKGDRWVIGDGDDMEHLHSRRCRGRSICC